MKVIAPHMSCVVSLPLDSEGPNEFEQAKADGYVEIYVVGPSGIIKYHKLRGENRYLQLKVDSVPGVTLPTLAEDVSFLPAGKIPHALFQQIEAFFRKVMEVKKDQLEAMIWVLWSQEQGYFLHVPEQTVSKASVRYDWDSVPLGATMVADIHSHNTMGAFFSGTDNNDDRNAIGFSGVFGHLDKSEPATVWRFNYRDKKYEAKLSDVFEQPAKPQVQIPNDWIGQIKTITPTYTKPSSATAAAVGSSYLNINARRYTPGQYNLGLSLGADEDDDKPTATGKGKGKGGAAKKAESPLAKGIAGGLGLTADLSGLISEDDAMERLANIDLANVEAQIAANAIGMDIDFEDPVGAACTFMDSDRFNELMCTHGPRVATSFLEINDRMVDLEGEDDLLKELVGDIVGLMDGDKVSQLFRAIYDVLPKAEKERIASYGL